MNMSDNVDKAQRTMDRLSSKMLSIRKHVPNIKPIGMCHYCKEVVTEMQLFCNGDCADDFERLTPANIAR